jgi:hypothetical protein
MKNKYLFSGLLILFILSACAAGTMTFIPRSGGQALKATYENSMGRKTIDIVLPSGETFHGNLTWIPPGGRISTATVLIGQTSAVASGMSSGDTGIYLGSIVGDRDTTMRIELLCNVWTGRCVGAGQTNEGFIYDIQQ